MDNPLIKKKVLYTGTKSLTFTPGSKVQFHFRTLTCGEDKITLDDSKKVNRPMELVIGKKFKLEVWEVAVQSMALNEVSSFVVDKSLTTAYPFVAKTLRDLDKPKQQQTHCCGALLHSEGVGYQDLNKLIKQPVDLEFILELIKFESPEEYEKEAWQMDDNEKLKVIPVLKESGNIFYSEKNYQRAAEKYCLALGMLEQLMVKEKPGDTEWNDLNKIKLPILLNYAQCKLIEEEYYTVIEHCNTVLSFEPNNVKALYRRGKAHVGAWNCNEARNDFEKAMKLDSSLTNLIRKDINDLEKKIREKNEQDKCLLQSKLF